jgi:hypothetical protein
MADYRYNIKTDLKNLGWNGVVWPTFIWLRIVTGGKFL